MQLFLEQIFNGLAVGGMYALIVAGLALTVGVLRVVNFSHGDLFMLGGYIFYFFFVVLGLTYIPAAVVAILVMGVVGLIFERLVIHQVVERSWRVQLIATVAAATVINNMVIFLVGTVPKTTPTVLSRTTVTFLNMTMSWQRLIIIGVSLIAFLGLHLFLTRTRMGKAMRAVSQNRDAAYAAGIEIHHVSRVTFVLATLLIGLSNVLVTPLFAVFPAMGLMLTLKAFAVLMVAGFGRVDTAIPAAFMLGIAEALGTGYLGSSYTDAFAFVAMILVLLISPQGLFGRKVGI
jgi:branched-chain amino acid transport system permease protein